MAKLSATATPLIPPGPEHKGSPLQLSSPSTLRSGQSQARIGNFLAQQLATDLDNIRVQVNALFTLGLIAPTITITGDALTGNLAITGTLASGGGFGANGATPQTPAASGGAAAATGATNVVPWGYTTALQADEIVTLLNNIRAALVANGIMS